MDENAQTSRYLLTINLTLWYLDVIIPLHLPSAFSMNKHLQYLIYLALNIIPEVYSLVSKTLNKNKDLGKWPYSG